MAAARGSPTKRVEAETTNTLLHAKDGSDSTLSKKTKRPPPPPPTAFYIFMSDFRRNYQEENEYVNLKDVGKLGGEKWKSFSEDEKKVYWDSAAQLMERYNMSLESDDSDSDEDDSDSDEDEEYKTRKLMLSMIAKEKNKRR